jgi:hypothetical protein
MISTPRSAVMFASPAGERGFRLGLGLGVGAGFGLGYGLGLAAPGVASALLAAEELSFEVFASLFPAMTGSAATMTKNMLNSRFFVCLSIKSVLPYSGAF